MSLETKCNFVMNTRIRHDNVVIFLSSICIHKSVDILFNAIYIRYISKRGENIMIILNSKDFSDSSLWSSSQMILSLVEPLPEIEGFRKAHENCLYRQGRLQVKLDGNETKIYCYEEYNRKTEKYEYRFAV